MQLGIPVVLGELPFALLAAVALAAFPLALLTALFVIWLFRRAVARSMAATGGAGKTVEPAWGKTGDGHLTSLWWLPREVRTRAAPRATRPSVPC